MLSLRYCGGQSTLLFKIAKTTLGGKNLNANGFMQQTVPKQPATIESVEADFVGAIYLRL